MKPRDADCAELGRSTAVPAATPAAAAQPNPLPVEADPSRVEAAREDELIMHLERDQFVAETSRPVARATLGRHSIAALWALRVFAIAVSLMVVYTFVSQLH
jgi:hypothetical protein